MNKPLDPSQKVRSFAARPAITRPVFHVPAFWGLLLLFGTFLSHGGLGGPGGHPSAVAAAAGALLVAAVAALLVLLLAPQRLRVGGDGVEVIRLWRRRFLRYDEIAAVAPYEKGSWRNRLVGLHLALHSGEDVRVPMLGSEDVADAEARIDEAMARLRRGDVEVDAAVLRRGERALGAWVTALRSLGAGANADLRTAPVPRERLFRIVEDAARPSVDRAAAAVALGRDLDDEGRVRLRSAAEATAAPRLRVALEKAAGAEGDAELEAALADIEEGEEPRTRVA